MFSLTKTDRQRIKETDQKGTTPKRNGVVFLIRNGEDIGKRRR
jgi:hypothetical protein